MVKHPAYEHFEFQRGLGRVALAVDRAPDLEPLLGCGERADPGADAVADHERGVVAEQGRDLGLVGLHLLVRAPDRGVGVGSVLEFDQPQGDAVDENSDVGAAAARALDNRELVHGQPVILAWGLEINEPDAVTGDGAVRARVLTSTPFLSMRWKMVGLTRRCGHTQNPDGVLLGFGGDIRIEAPRRRAAVRSTVSPNESRSAADSSGAMQAERDRVVP